jgi:hypothetical protein
MGNLVKKKNAKNERQKQGAIKRNNGGTSPHSNGFHER